LASKREGGRKRRRRREILDLEAAILVHRHFEYHFFVLYSGRISGDKNCV
jgi:hypothetical protein